MSWISYVNKEHMGYKSPTGQVAGSQVTQIVSIDATPTKDIHDIIDEGSSMTLTGRGNKPSAL